MIAAPERWKALPHPLKVARAPSRPDSGRKRHGKELVRDIHATAQFAKAFLPVDCGSLVPR